MCWQADACVLLLACGDNQIKMYDMGSQQVSTIGQHEKPVKDVCSLIDPQTSTSVVITGGWDARVKFWNWQQTQQGNTL